MKRILAIDPGSSIIGLCYGEDSPVFIDSIKTPSKLDFPQRLLFLREKLLEVHFDADILVLEFAQYMINRPGQQQVYAAAGMIIGIFKEIPTIQLVHPAKWKKEITGNGNSKKDKIKESILQRWPDIATNLQQDCYDALGLWTWAFGLKENGKES